MGDCARIMHLFKTTTFLLKFLELILDLACVGLMTGHCIQTFDPSRLQTVHATLFGFFMLQIVIVLGYLLDYPIHRIVVMVICTTAIVMYLISGGVMIEVWHKYRPTVHDNVLGAGILSLFTGVAYGVDVSLTLINCRNGGTNPFGQA